MLQQEEEEEEPEAFEVEKIVDRRLIGSGSRRKISKAAIAARMQEEADAAAANFPPDAYEYRILWKGYSEEESTWEPFSCLDACPRALREFLADLKQNRVGTVEAAASASSSASPSPMKNRASVTLKSNPTPTSAHESRGIDMSTSELPQQRTATGVPSASKHRNAIPPTHQRDHVAAAASTPVPAIPSGVWPTTFKSVIGDPPAVPRPPPSKADESVLTGSDVAPAAFKRDQVERKSQIRPTEPASLSVNQQQSEFDTNGNEKIDVAIPPAVASSADDPEEKSATRPGISTNTGDVIELDLSSEDDAAALHNNTSSKSRSHRSRGIRRRRSSPTFFESEHPMNFEGVRPKRIAAQQAGLLAKLSKAFDANMSDIRALLAEKVDPSLAQKVAHRAAAEGGTGAAMQGEGSERKAQPSKRKSQTKWERRKARKLAEADTAAAAASSSTASKSPEGPFFARHSRIGPPLEDFLMEELMEVEPVGVDYIASVKRNPDFGRPRAQKALRESANLYAVKWDDGSETWEPESILKVVPYARRDFIKRQAIAQWRSDHPGEYEIGGEEEQAGREEFEFISRAQEEFEYEDEEEGDGRKDSRFAAEEEEIDTHLYHTLASMVTSHDRERMEAEHAARERVRRKREKEARRQERKKEEKKNKHEEAQKKGAITTTAAILLPALAAVKSIAPKKPVHQRKNRLLGLETKSAATLAGDAVRAQNTALAQQYSVMYMQMQQSNLIGPDGVPLVPIRALGTAWYASPASLDDSTAAGSLSTTTGTSASSFASPAVPPPPTTFYPLMPAPGTNVHQPMLTPLEFEAALAKAQLEAESLARARELAEEEFLLHESEDQEDVDEEFYSDKPWQGAKGGSSGGAGARKAMSASKSAGKSSAPHNRHSTRRSKYNPLDTPGLRALNQLQYYGFKKLSDAMFAGKPMPKVTSKKEDATPDAMKLIAAEWETEKMRIALVGGRKAESKAFEPSSHPYLEAEMVAVVSGENAPSATDGTLASATSPPKTRPSVFNFVFGERLPSVAATPFPASAAGAAAITSSLSATSAPSSYQHPSFPSVSLTSVPPSVAQPTISVAPLAQHSAYTITSPSRAIAATASQPINPEAMLERALARMQAAGSAPAAQTVPAPGVPTGDALMAASSLP